MFHFLAVWTACSSVTAEPAEPLGAIVTDVVAALDRAAELAPTDSGTAMAAWSAAHDRFEADLEPRLRLHQDATEVVRAEYAFAQVRGALGTDDAHAAVTSLAERLDRLVPGTFSASRTGGSRSVAAR